MKKISVMALINQWEEKADLLGEEGRESNSPLILLDKLHQADVYEKCAGALRREINLPSRAEAMVTKRVPNP